MAPSPGRARIMSSCAVGVWSELSGARSGWPSAVAQAGHPGAQASASQIESGKPNAR
jgi:hypothetical protein